MTNNSHLSGASHQTAYYTSGYDEMAGCKDFSADHGAVKEPSNKTITWTINGVPHNALTFFYTCGY